MILEIKTLLQIREKGKENTIREFLKEANYKFEI